MVVSKEAYLKKFNLETIAPVSEIDDIVNTNEVFTAQNKQNTSTEIAADTEFYTAEELAEILPAKTLEHLCLCCLIDDAKSSDNIEELISQQQAEKGKGFKFVMPVTDAALGMVPEQAFIAALISSFDSIEKTPLVNLLKKQFKAAADYIKASKKQGYQCYAGYKTEIIDKLDDSKGKLKAMLAFLYMQAAVNNHKLEKAAVDSFLNLSGLKATCLHKITDDEFLQTRREAKNWLKKHKRAKSLADLALLNDEALEHIAMIYQLLAVMELDYTAFNLNKSVSDLDQERLQKIFAVLNRYPEFKDNERLKELMIYLCCAVWPILGQGKLYAEKFLKQKLKVKQKATEHMEEVSRLKAQAAPLNSIIDEKEAQMKKLQADYKRLQYTSEKEIAELKAQLEEQKQLVEDFLKDNQLMQQLNKTLEDRVDELDCPEEEVVEETSIVPNSYVQGKLKSLNILIMGGHQVWQNRLKELYPYFNYIDSENVNYDINITRNADVVLFNTLHCSHTLYYRMKNNVNNGREENKGKVIYIGSNNLNYFKEIVSNLVLEKLQE